MKKLAVLLLIFAVGTTGSIAALASTFSLPEKNMPDFTGSVPVSTQEKTVNGPSETDTAYTIITPIETAANTETVQDEIYYKMLNSVDYFSTAKVSFSALFPGFETVQDYTIETDLNTGVAHQTCSDYFLKTDKDISAVYETYSDGRTIREYDNAAYTSRFVSAAEERHSLVEEWGDSERYYVDENNECIIATAAIPQTRIWRANACSRRFPHSPIWPIKAFGMSPGSSHTAGANATPSLAL